MSIWDLFPNVQNIQYTSVQEGGNVVFTLPKVITSPRKRIEAGPSYGAYKRWLTTHKIDPAIWNANAPGTTIAVLGPDPYTGSYGPGNDPEAGLWFSDPNVSIGSYYLLLGQAPGWGLYQVGNATPLATATTLSGLGLQIGTSTLYPKMRDQLVVNSVTWTVHKDVDSPANNLGILGLWRLPSTYLEIDSNLADTITITLPADSSDNYSSPLTTAGTATSYTARIQFDHEDTYDFHGIQYMRSWYRIYVAGLNGVAANLPLGTTMTATAGEYSGQVFRVTDNANIDLLDELPMYTVTVDPVQQAAA